MNSNITLRSNIYVNKTARRDDREFLSKVKDYRVLKKLINDPSVIGYNGADWLSVTQNDILLQGDPQCSLEIGTKSWGVPVGEDRMRCRCEQTTCSRYHQCAQLWNFDEIVREPVDDNVGRSVEKTHNLPLYNADSDSDVTDTPIDLAPQTVPEVSAEPIQWDNPVIEPATDILRQEQPVKENIASETPSSPEVPLKPVGSDVPVPEKQLDTNTIQIVDQAKIIDAPTDVRIWVNAGPGTGKTYTVIQRLLRLLQKGTESTILVLCFSKNAVQEIRNRLTDVLGRQVDALIEDGQLVIRTYDSFASYLLDDELNTAWDYDRRIEEFIKMLKRNSGTLNEMIAYLVVDEIQDTVGVRARMLLAMLDELSCGVLLLGDRCQAIFDWTTRETGDMSYDAFAEQLAQRQFMRLELKGNHRQEVELAGMGDQLRDKMLRDDEEAQKAAVEVFKTWVRGKWRDYTIKGLPQVIGGDGDLVLTRTNGEAARISQSLFESASQVNHIMKQSTGHRSLAPWIALVLRDSDGRNMSRDLFMKNARQYAIADPEEKWEVLKSIDGYPHAPTLHIPEVLKALSQKDGIPDICMNRYESCAVVSTVHRAKGSEAEHVYWLDGPLLYDAEQGEEGALKDALRAAYVAATRAKHDIHLLTADKKFYMKLTSGGRWIRTGLGKNGKKYCSGIAFQPEDTDEASFADDVSGIDAQEILSTLEPGMPVTLYPNSEMRRFEIFFDGMRIGTTSETFTDALFGGFDETNHNKNWPTSIPDVYITSIVTVIAPGCPGVAQQYSQSGCWLGIELGGFPTLEWY